MKISFNLLKNYLKLPVDAVKLCDILNNLGLAVEQVSENGNDTILDIEITVNRSDCLSHYGIARELAAYFNLPLKKPLTSIKEGTKLINELITIEIMNPNLCHRYCSRVILNVSVKESPEWLKSFLLSVGLRPVNNIVDLTNYVMYELGHPLHAFDYDKIAQKKVLIRTAFNYEKILAINNKEYNLDNDMLVIADAEKPIAIAGVIGGKDSEISFDTKNILLESAYFDPVNIRRTSKKLDLNTDASYRFERNTDINIIPLALNKVAQLIGEIAQGELSQGIIDIYPIYHEGEKIKFHPSKVEYIIGEKIPLPFIRELLKRLDFEILETKEDLWTIGIPSYRTDVKREIEVIEIIAKHYGYDKIKPTMPLIAKKTLENYPNYKIENDIKKNLIPLGFNEIISSSFLNRKIADLFKNDIELIEISNPISEDCNILRPNLASSMILCTKYNLEHSNNELSFFEIGKVFQEGKAQLEAEHLCLLLSIQENKNKWASTHQKKDIFYLKGIIEHLFRFLTLKWDKPEVPINFLHKDMQSIIKINNEKVGYLGLLNPKIMQELEIKPKIALAELNLDIINKMPISNICFQPYPTQPTIFRNISLIFDKNIQFEAIKKVFDEVKDDRFLSYKLIDVYRGASIPKDKISYTFELSFNHPHMNLTSEDINELCNYIISAMKDKLNASLR